MTRRLRWSRADAVAVGFVTVIGGLLRFVRLDVPRKIVFDEVFYALDGCLYATSSERLCGIPHEQSLLHPPLGKLFVALGIRAFGNDTFGWRIAPALLGTITIALVYVLARRLGMTAGVATLASTLVALDALHLVNSRVAMLEVFVTAFVVAAVLFSVFDRDLILGRAAREGSRSGHYRWRALAGAACGAAIACKWSAIPVLLLLIVLTVAWETSARRRDGDETPFLHAVREELPSLLVCFGIVPLMVYSATFLGRVEGSLLAAPWHPDSWIRTFLGRQRFMLSESLALEGPNMYQSPAWSWFLLKRPITYFIDIHDGGVRHILAVGNPLVWWPGLAALAYQSARMVRRRDPLRAEIVVVGSFTALVAPWLLAPRSFIFLFYLVPAIPFLGLALAGTAGELWSRSRWRVAVVGVGIAAAAAFAFYFPSLTAIPQSVCAWEWRLPFSGCGDLTTIGRADGAAVRVYQDEEPPRGWCWR